MPRDRSLARRGNDFPPSICVDKWSLALFCERRRFTILWWEMTTQITHDEDDRFSLSDIRMMGPLNLRISVHVLASVKHARSVEGNIGVWLYVSSCGSIPVSLIVQSLFIKYSDVLQIPPVLWINAAVPDSQTKKENCTTNTHTQVDLFPLVKKKEKGWSALV